MDLTKLGLSAKEVAFYTELLTHGPQTARTLSRETNEQRTNCYLILDSLIDRGLVERDDSYPVTRFRANHPNNLKRIAQHKQRALASTTRDLNKQLPELTSLYRLSTEKQGIAYFNGVRGYEAVLDDMSNTGEVLVFISKTIFNNQPRIYTMVQNKLSQRGKNKVLSRFLTCDATKAALHTGNFRHSNMEVRVTSADIFDGEIAIYANKIALTTYGKQNLTTLVLTDPAQAKTFRSIFEMVWEAAE